MKKTKKSYHQLAVERMEKETNRAVSQVEKLAKLYSQQTKK
jgi:hypothetical protein